MSDQKSAAPQSGHGRKGRIEVASLLALRICSCSPSVRAAACRSFNRFRHRDCWVRRKATMLALGTNSCISSSRFGPISAYKPGYARDVPAWAVEAGDKPKPLRGRHPS